MAKEKASRFFSTVSMHGISRLVATESLIVRIVWTLMISGSILCGIYIISKSAHDFNMHDVITNIERVSPEQAIFPAVTVCMVDSGMKKIQMINRTTEGYSEYKPKMSHYNLSIAHFISAITFNDRTLNRSEVDFFEIMTFNNQVDYSCVRFNGGTTKKHELEVVDSRLLLKPLTFKFYDELYEDMLSSNETFKYYNMFYYHLYVGDNYLNSHLNVNPFVVENCYDYVITTTKSDFERKLPEPYNQCTYSVDESYRQINCIEMCINKEFKEKYNCSVKSYYKVAGLDFCHDIHSINISKTIGRFYTDCQGECPRECDTVKFTSQVMIETKKRYNEFNPTYNLNDSYEPYTNISFFLTDFSTLKITQIPKMRPFDLIANIGGSFGLFVGISFLSFIEVFEFIIDVFICLVF